MFLNGNFVAQAAFQKRYGVQVADGYAIETKWQSALFQAGQCGAFVGVFLAGPVVNKFGYRWTTIFALILMNATIFISFFVSRATTMFIPFRCLTACYLGPITRAPYCWTGIGGYPLGILHCHWSRLRIRDRSSRPSRCLHCYSADVLVHWLHRRCWRYSWLQQA